ncbi:MAG: inositol-3-phosphate synthase [Planctomycetota bacterium]
MAKQKFGVWFVGARGGVASVASLGLAALQRRLTAGAGLVSELPWFAALGLVDWKDLVVGGHDIRTEPLVESLTKLTGREAAVDPELLKATKRDLAKMERNIRLGTLHNVGDAISHLADGRHRRKQESPREIIERLQADLTDFQRRQRLEDVVVVNLASTEPPLDDRAVPRKWNELEKALSQPRKCPKLSASSLYAIAALDLGFPYVNFTPSIGSSLRAIADLARERQTCHAGRDGKTGETLVKSTLAPMFFKRNLEVMSWVGHNIFGNMDGQVLKDPANKQSKVVSKDKILGEILGYHPQSHISIEFIESLGDWKTAWDHIHFRGFLGTPMKMQFTWQGSDSLLAAPLVLDLARFALKARQAGTVGTLKFLASFFKSPMDVKENDFGEQFRMLVEWSKSLEAAKP